MADSRRRVNQFNHNLKTNEHNITQSNKLTSIDTQTTLTNTKLDSLSGAVNNNLGDAQVKLQTYVYAHDSAGGLARPLKCDTSGRLECSVDALEVTAETINLSTDTLEAIGTATKNALFTNPAGSGNTIGENASAINQNIITSNSKLDTIITNTAASSSTGLATETTLAAAEAHLGNVETSVQLLDDVVTAQSAAHPGKANAIGGRYYVDNTFRDIRVDDIGKVIVDSPAGSDINTRLDNITNNTSAISDAEVHLSAIDTNIVNAEAHLGLIDSNMAQAELHLSALDTNITNRLPSTIGPKDESLSLTIARNNTTGAFDSHCRTNITDRATSKALLCDSDGKQIVKKNDNITNSSEVSYVSGQAISGSGTFTGSAIAVDANTRAFYLEHNFSHTGIKYELMGSIDGTNFFGTGVELNAGGLSPATLTGLNTSLGTSTSIHSFPPHIKFKFSNSDSSAQTITLSYVQQIG